MGYVTCLKNGCNAVIPLARRFRPYDGGKGDGLGSLSAYRVRPRYLYLLAQNDQTLQQLHISESHSAYRERIQVKSESSSSLSVCDFVYC